MWFVILAAACLVGPYVAGVPPRTRRQWRYIAITIALLAWVLLLMVSLRSRSVDGPAKAGHYGHDRRRSQSNESRATSGE